MHVIMRLQWYVVWRLCFWGKEYKEGLGVRTWWRACLERVCKSNSQLYLLCQGFLPLLASNRGNLIDQTILHLPSIHSPILEFSCIVIHQSQKAQNWKET